MPGGMQRLARGGSFALFRTQLGHVAVVGRIRSNTEVEISIANVDLVPVASPCLVVDCSESDQEARSIAATTMDSVLARAAIEPLVEVWIVPRPTGERRSLLPLTERAFTQHVEVTYSEAEAVATILRIRQVPAGTDIGIRWSAILHAARTMAARDAGKLPTASQMARLDELLLRSAIGQIRESILVTDADLEAPGPRILYVNPAFTEMTGYEPSEVLGKSPRVLQGPRSDRAVLRRLRSTLENGGVFEGETVNYRKDGTEFSVQWTVHPLRDEHGRTVRYFAIQRDTTERRRYEAVARAVNITDNIGMIFSGIRHELGNPVNSIKTALSVLRKQHRIFGSEKIDTYLERIMAEVTRVEFLLSSLRSYTAFERAKLEDVDVRVFLSDFARLVRSDLAARAIELEIVEENEVPSVRVDPRALNQVLLNLVHNACDALLDVDEKHVRLIASAAGSRVKLVVRDNGCGMSPEHLDRLFVPFHTTKERGTGLGLVITQKLVTEMGGQLRVESERRRGTDVTIELARAGGARC